nr:immunoglobulin light chain junction region [Macaca mulatta]
CQQNTNWPLTF